MSNIVDTIAQLTIQIADLNATKTDLQTYPTVDPFASGKILKWVSTDGLEVGVAVRGTTYWAIALVKTAKSWTILKEWSWDNLAIDLATRKINYTTEVFQLN